MPRLLAHALLLREQQGHQPALRNLQAPAYPQTAFRRRAGRGEAADGAGDGAVAVRAAALRCELYGLIIVPPLVRTIISLGGQGVNFEWTNGGSSLRLFCSRRDDWRWFCIAGDTRVTGVKDFDHGFEV